MTPFEWALLIIGIALLIALLVWLSKRNGGDAFDGLAEVLCTIDWSSDSDWSGDGGGFSGGGSSGSWDD